MSLSAIINILFSLLGSPGILPVGKAPLVIKVLSDALHAYHDVAGHAATEQVTSDAVALLQDLKDLGVIQGSFVDGAIGNATQFASFVANVKGDQLAIAARNLSVDGVPVEVVAVKEGGDAQTKLRAAFN